MSEETHRKIDYEALLHKNHNKGLIALILIIICGYLFFFLSPLIFHETPDKTVTKLNSEISFLNGKLTINNWIYSKNQKLMEVSCSTNGISLKNIKFEASCNYTYRSKGTSPLPVQQVFSSTDYFVVCIYDIPEDIYCVSLRGSIDTAQETTVDTTHNNEQDDSNNNFGYIFTCVDDVSNVDYIDENKDDKAYLIEKAQKQIANNKQAIQDNLDRITQIDKQIESYNQDIKAIKSEKAFQIQSERQKSDARIATIENTITSLSRQKTQLESENTRLQKEISDYGTVIWQLGG